MTADLFTRLAHRAIGGAGITVQPAPEPEPVWDEEDTMDLASEVDAPPATDAPPTTDAVHSPAPVPAGPAVASPVPGPVTPVSVPLPGRPADPVPGSPVVATPPSARASAAAPPLVPDPADPGNDSSPAGAGTAQLRQRAGTLEPPPMPLIGPHARPPDHRPAPPTTPHTSVEVTVGRIEIRVRPPAHGDTGRPRPAVSPAPALLLEEYLRRREASS
jgi:hypothetical protein